MDEILLKQNGVHLTKQVEVMGSMEQLEKDMSYDELNENYDLQLDLEKIDPDTDENGDFAVRLQLNTHQEGGGETSEGFEDVPPVPEVPQEDMKDNRWQFYRRMQNPERQPFDTRRLIYESGELTERELKQLLHDEGYESIEPGKQNGSLAATLVVLDEVTEEIERRGRGEGKTIEWVGAE